MVTKSPEHVLNVTGIRTDLARMEDAGSTGIISIFSQVFDLL